MQQEEAGTRIRNLIANRLRQLLPEHKKVERPEKEQANIKKYGKFRYLVAKHFLSKPLDQIVNNSYQLSNLEHVNVKLVANLAILQDLFDKVFLYGIEHTLGSCYLKVQKSFFNNAYMQLRNEYLFDHHFAPFENIRILEN